MQMADKVYGAYSKVFIQYEGSLQDLGSKIEKGLNIPEIRYENMEDEPYDLVGYYEVLGFEVELRSIHDSEKWPDYQYFLGVTTTDSFQEVFNDQMFDISLWMARYISLSCEVTTMAENLDKQTGQSFYFNKTTLKRESSIIEASQ
ncbi:hypothetical protein BBR47_17780 [Brevibacillus brevis NBRC 100599]|uniref:Uncharacterized protein n=1 Tax=Brevibacillus brevis (strain 47 / JCM 6285 / NBRC 100599) TaxID=358681 RepID=C0ZAE6_BREBN|nr:hypothetical protein [Brevibacillus brevis]BAH42755.1 hypothetical protein BBR47_17780 [Brevibacillus brevis NBRC 100599]